MLKPAFKGSFKKERKLMEKRHKNMDELTEVMDMLIKEQPLLPRHKNHPCMEIIKDGGNVMLNQTGSSSTVLIKRKTW
jgi:mRNA-degrading endonuclease YafQ of YafQ-DinJ toxin-antitoxin module